MGSSPTLLDDDARERLGLPPGVYEVRATPRERLKLPEWVEDAWKEAHRTELDLRERARRLPPYPCYERDQLKIESRRVEAWIAELNRIMVALRGLHDARHPPTFEVRRLEAPNETP